MSLLLCSSSSMDDSSIWMHVEMMNSNIDMDEKYAGY